MESSSNSRAASNGFVRFTQFGTVGAVADALGQISRNPK